MKIHILEHQTLYQENALKQLMLCSVTLIHSSRPSYYINHILLTVSNTVRAMGLVATWINRLCHTLGEEQ